MAFAIKETDNFTEGGFNFELSLRNAVLEHHGVKLPHAQSTGTTICGVVFKDGICLGADTRATNDTTVADPNCAKIHYIADNIYCCGAGTAADTEYTTELIASELELHRLSTGRQPRVVAALTKLKRKLFQYQGHIGAALVLGGVDVNGPSLYTVAPHGSTDRLPYVTMGSGSLAAMAVFERGFKDGMDEEEAKNIVRDAILAGIFNDLGSGSNVDICVITKDGARMFRNETKPNDRPYRRQAGYAFPRGTTEILPPLKARVEVQEAVAMQM